MNDIILPHHGRSDPLVSASPQAKRAFTGSPRDLLFVMFWHRKKVVAFFIVATLLTALAVLALPSTYRSEAKLLVKMGSDTVTPDVSAGMSGPMVQPVVYWEVQMKTELEVLRSRQIAMNVVEKVGAARILRQGNLGELTREDPLYNQALLALQTNLSLELVPDSSILLVGYESGDGKLARDITDAYVAAYLDLRLAVRDSGHGASFLAGEREQMLVKVQQLEDDIRTIKDNAGVGNIDEQRQILQARIGAMQSDIATARALCITTAAEVAKLEQRIVTIPERIISSETIEQSMSWRDEQKKEIAKIELDLADLKARYADNSPQVQIAQQRLAAARGTLDAGKGGNERVESINPVWQTMLQRLEDARTNATVAQAKESALEAEVAKAQITLKSINDVELKIKQLLRAANLREDQLRQISLAADRESLLAAFQGEKLNNVSIVQPATLPLRPVAPNRLMLLMIGMFVAGSGAVGLGIASETLSRTTKRPEDIDRLTALPSVSIPVIDAHGFIGNGYMKNRVAPAGSRVARLLTDSGESQTTVITRANGTSTGAPVGTLTRTVTGTTDIRPVRRWSPQLLQSAHGIIDGLLFDSIHEAKHQTAFVTGLISCRPGQGASTLSAYVASAVADRLEASIPLHPDDRVLLIDADLNEPALHQLLSIDDSPGLGDWLAIHSTEQSPITDFTHPTSHGRLSVMPSGRSSTLMRLLDRSDLLITEATRHYRHIVMDLPPVSSTPTALRLAAKCNAVLLVVECGNLHQEVVRKSVRALQSAGANVAGVILNKRRFPIPDWLYERAS